MPGHLPSICCLLQKQMGGKWLCLWWERILCVANSFWSQCSFWKGKTSYCPSCNSSDSRRLMLLSWVPSCQTLVAPSVSTWESHFTPLWRLATWFSLELAPFGLSLDSKNRNKYFLCCCPEQLVTQNAEPQAQSQPIANKFKDSISPNWATHQM